MTSTTPMNPLSIGASGRAVAFLQARIGARSDGSFGPLTQAALKAAQAHSRLPATGVYDALTNKVFTQRTAGIIDTLALQLGVEPAALDALIKVETAGAGFLDDGRPKILLERHYVYRLVPVQLRSSMPTDICNETPGGYSGGPAEWDRFERVAALAGADVAIQSCSWGLGQIMGANFRACGYLSTTLYMNDCAATEDKQLAVMVGFLKASPKLVAGLKVRDWTAVAVGYNGPAQNGYDSRLAAAYAASNLSKAQ